MKISLRLLSNTFIPATKEDAEKLQDFNKQCIYEVDIKVKKRTNPQNRAYWKWCNMIADTLNKENKNLSYVLDLGSYYNKDIVHETITKSILKDKLKKDSTTKLNKNELDTFIDEVVLFLAGNGIECPTFPTKDDK